MENKLKVFGVTVLILIFGLFLPSFYSFEIWIRMRGEQLQAYEQKQSTQMTWARKFFMIVICVRKIGKKRFLLKSLNSVRVFSDYQLNSL